MLALAAALVCEVAQLAEWCRPASALSGECLRFASTVERLQLDDSVDWEVAKAGYRKLCDSVASALNREACIAQSYTSMDAFWSDAEAQSRGESPFSFWDSYEHGRRRQLEQVVARTYGAQDALLLNTGMAAVAAAIEAGALRPGDRITAGISSYFETSQFLEDYVQQRGAVLVRAPIDDPSAFSLELARSDPRLVIFETATNAPEVQVPRDPVNWFSAAPRALFVCDNTVQGALSRWFGDPHLRATLPSRFLAVESATKYISQSVMAGIVYGDAPTVQAARLFARAAGLHLQERAFNHLRVGNIQHVDIRLRLHSRNVREIAKRVAQVEQDLFEIRLLDSAAGSQNGGCKLFAEGVGGLIFLVPRKKYVARGAARELSHRLFREWRDRATAAGGVLSVRAGFGWDETSVRIYESDALNQRSAPCYVRIAVGIEPPHAIERLAAALSKSLEALQ